jgi:carboxylesterase
MTDHRIDLPGGENSVLLVHGLTGSPFELKYFAKKLNQAGFTVKAPCLAGHGKTVEELAKTRWSDWYSSVFGSFMEMKKNYRTVSVAGLCMGALLALHLAHQVGSEINGTALMSTTIFYDGWSLPWYKFLLPIAYFPPLRYIYSYEEKEPYGIKNQAWRDRIVNLMKNDSIAYIKTPAASMYELFKLIKEVKRELPAIKTPTLILHSKEDDLTSTKNADYVEERIGALKVKKVILDNCYHMMTIDNQKDTVAEEMTKFFKDLVSSE